MTQFQRKDADPSAILPKFGENSRQVVTMESLEKRFDLEMLNIYLRALREANYNAKRFLRMLDDNRGRETARLLIHAPTVSEGYTALWERKRLDLTVEALIHDNPEWHPLFTDDELEIVGKRLIEYRYAKAINPS